MASKIPLQVWVVVYRPNLFSDDLFQRALGFMDPESAARIKRFYRREDACRTLIGRLLTRMVVRKQGILLNAMSFATTDTGKPYIANSISPPLAYNISHDNSLVAMAFASGKHNGPAYNIGVDVMKVRVPGRSTFASFVRTVGDQLTPVEHRLLSGVAKDEALRRFFWMWTMKEAYTKALGLGLGFDFSRVEFNVETNVVRVDGQIPLGWYFAKFVIKDEGDFYQGVVAEYIGGDQTVVIPESETTPDWLSTFDAVSFAGRAIQQLEDS